MEFGPHAWKACAFGGWPFGIWNIKTSWPVEPNLIVSKTKSLAVEK